jgi:hypothetical protein
MATCAPATAAKNGARRAPRRPVLLRARVRRRSPRPRAPNPSARRRRSQCKTCGDKDKASAEQSEAAESIEADADAPEAEPAPDETAEPPPVLGGAKPSGGSALSALVVAGVIVLAVGTIVAVHFSNSMPTAKQRRAARAQGLEQAILSCEAE